MDAFGDVVPNYYPAHPMLRPEHEIWDDQLFRGPVTADLDRLTMQRYLQESDLRLFTPHSWDSYPTKLPYSAFDVPASNYQVLDALPYPYPVVQRCSSPTTSWPMSSYTDSSWSDQQSTPWSSPTPSIPTFSPGVSSPDTLPFGCGDQPPLIDHRLDSNGHCVALHDVQVYADAQPEKDAFDDYHETYDAHFVQESPEVHEGYEQIQSQTEQTDYSLTDGSSAISSQQSHSDSPNIRRRRPQAPRSITSPRGTSRIARRPTGGRRAQSHSTVIERVVDNGASNSNRAFPCILSVYGCKSTFNSKNEWKRHVNTQHMHLGYYRCDLCDQGGRKPNDFNRKDLFTQHIRRMHPSEKTKNVKTKVGNAKNAKCDPVDEVEVKRATDRCWRRVRSPPPQSGCLFCEAQFTGVGSWGRAARTCWQTYGRD